MRIWIDTEFVDRGVALSATSDLISIGMVREDGKELYFENASFYQKGRLSEFHEKHVIPKLTGKDKRLWLPELADEITRFMADVEKPEFWAFYAAYDWVLFCKIFGTLMDLPKGWPQLCLDVKQLMIWIGIDDEPARLVQDPATKHHALHDARWLRDLHLWIDKPDP